jgi:hypothetical protein
MADTHENVDLSNTHPIHTHLWQKELMTDWAKEDDIAESKSFIDAVNVYSNMKQTKKLDKYALEYIRPALYFQLYDCCDSMRDSEKLEERFLAICDDAFIIEDYIEKFHLKQYIDTIFEVAEENGDVVTKENFREFLDGTPSSFPEHIKSYFEKPNNT